MVANPTNMLTPRSKGPFRAQGLGVSLAVLGLALAATAMVFVRTAEFGIGLSPDSTQYISMARNLLTGTDDFAGGSLRPAWPPLFVLVVSVPGVIGADPLATASILNPLLLGVLCLVSGLWIYRRTRAPLVTIAVTAVLAVSIPLARVASFAWTEPLFILLTTSSILTIGQFLRSGSRHVLWLAGFFAAAACLTRYAGVALVASVAIVLTTTPGIPHRRRIWDVLVFAAIAMAPVTLWLLRNYLVAGTIAGARAPSDSSLAQSFADVVVTFGMWAIPLRNPQYGFVLVISAIPLVAVIVALATACRALVRRHGIRGAVAQLRVRDPSLYVLICYSLVYVAFIVLMSTWVSFDGINDRLLSPVFVPVALAIGVLGASFGRGLKEGRCNRHHYGAIMATVSVFVVSYIACYVPEMQRAIRHGHGYASAKWENSEAISWLRSVDEDTVLSNEAGALYILVPEIASKWLPRSVVDLPIRVATARSGRVVWFHRTRYGYELSAFEEELGLRKEREFEDAVIYLITSGAEGDEDNPEHPESRHTTGRPRIGIADV